MDPTVCQHVAAIGDTSILKADNAQSHTAHIMLQLLEELIVQMEWPSQSSDLNPIEHVWDALWWCVAGLQPFSKTLGELRTALHHQWALLPMQFNNNIINSIRYCCQACTAVDDDHADLSDLNFISFVCPNLTDFM
ncbi:Transposable element Tc1 transposase, partial [Stegodyphus mimosarum]